MSNVTMPLKSNMNAIDITTPQLWATEKNINVEFKQVQIRKCGFGLRQSTSP